MKGQESCTLKVRVFNKHGTGVIRYAYTKYQFPNLQRQAKHAATVMGPRRNLIHPPSVLQSQGTWDYRSL